MHLLSGQKQLAIFYAFVVRIKKGTTGKELFHVNIRLPVLGCLLEESWKMESKLPELRTAPSQQDKPAAQHRATALG